MTPLVLLIALAAVLAVALMRLLKSVLTSLVAGTLIPCFCFKWIGKYLYGPDPFDQVELYILLAIVSFTNLAALAISSAGMDDD